MLIGILSSVLVLLEVVLLFNLLILVHEWGHFLAARLCGMKVERFSIWFGKPIWKKKINGVEYCLGSIPAGGYVALPQMADMEAIEGKNETPAEKLPPAKPLHKIIVAFAGPLFSLGLALFFACIVYFVGRPVNEFEASCKVGFVEPGSEADKAGLKPLDVVVDINGHAIKKFAGMGDSVTWRIIAGEGDTIHMKVLRDGQPVSLEMKPQYDTEPRKFWQRRALREIPFYPAETDIRVARVLPDGPAAVAGIKPGDQIIELGEEPIYTSSSVSRFVTHNTNVPVPLTILRNGEKLHFTLVPELPISAPFEVKQPMLGIEWAPHLKIIHPSPFEQILASADAVVSTIQAWVSRDTDVTASHMQGPIGIMNIMAILFQSSEGWRQALWLAVLINVNLAILNMVPLPVLDGGHIMLSIIEAIRRKPINIRLLEVIQTACAMLIFGFMLYVTFFDVQDLRLPSFKSTPVKFAPKNITPSN
jgi:regulator of sigma E protease